MVDSDRRHRRDLLTLLLAAALALLASAFADGERTRRAVVEQASTEALVQLAVLAGLRDESGGSLRADPLEVTVIQEGGSAWIRDAVVDAVEGSDEFRVADSKHVLRIEPVETPSVIAIQLRLWRQGWDLRSPDLALGRASAWAPVLAGVLGAVVGFWLWRLGPGLLVAGPIAQALVAGLSWPSEAIAPMSWWTQVRTGPLLAPLARAAHAGWTTPLAVAVLVFCLVLVAFDHRRSRERGESMALADVGLTAFALAVGGVAWMEAALRAGLWASMHSLPGSLAVVALAVAWLPAIRRARERVRG